MTIKVVFEKIFSGQIFHKNTEIPPALSSYTNTITNRSNILDGTVCIRDGKIIITDPKNDGAYATMIVPESPLIQVFINGKQVIGEVILTETDSVDVGFSDREPSVDFENKVSSDELCVMVRVGVTKGVHASLSDCKPTKSLVLTDNIVYKNTYPNPTNPDVILDLLWTNGYDGEIDFDAVNRLCRAKETQEEVVLRGVVPKDGSSAKVRMSTSLCLESDNIFQTNRWKVVSVGTTVAVLEPEVKGIPGKNIFGEIVPVTVQMKEIPKLGQGVISVNGNIVAVKEGRLKYTKQMIDVVPELIIDRDITSRDNEIQFDGNVIVRGSIEHGSVLKASGTIMVYGNVKKSSVYSGGDILVKGGIFGSTVVAGHQQFVSQNLNDLLGRMIPELKRFKEEFSLLVSHALKQSNASSLLPKIPTILFENRHGNLEKMLAAFVGKFSNELLSSVYLELKELVKKTWTDSNRFKISQNDIDILIEKVAFFDEQLRSMPRDLSVIKVTNIASSTLRSIGNIIATGNCHSSTIESGNTVSIHKRLHGGFVVAKKSVNALELGSPLGVETSVRVENSSGFINVKLCHHNALLEVGGSRMRLLNTERNIRYRG